MTQATEMKISAIAPDITLREQVTILVGDVLDGLRSLPDASVHCCVTSPPYWGLRDYGVDGQIGLESSPDAYVSKMVEVFREVRRVLRDDGTLWLNLGDSYAQPGQQMRNRNGITKEFARPCRAGVADDGRCLEPDLKPKDLCMIPWRVALALQADGWYLRSVIVWAKKSPMPESVTDRPTSSWEPIFLLAKSERYFYDAEAVKEPLERGDAGSRFDSDRKLPIHPNTGTNRMPPIGGLKHAGSNGNATYSGDSPEWPSGRNQRNVWHLGPEPFKGFGQTVHWEPVEADALGDGIRRTESPDCPVHGRLGHGSCDERASVRYAHTCSSGDDPGSARCPSPCTSSRTVDATGQACSLGSENHQCSRPATSHSNRTRRTDHVHATSQPCTPSDQTCGRTRGTSVSRESFVPHPCTNASTSSADCEPDVSGSGPLEQTDSRTVGTCTCQYHRRVTKKVDHFATFPTEIPRRAIKAGTSEKGCCPACGSPWSRVVARQQIKRERPNDYTKRTGESGTGNSCANSVAGVESRTVGWEPSCQCNAGAPVPCVVLDPFLGSGTTIAVARTLGRHGVGCELNPEYAELARARIGKAERPHTFADHRPKGDAPLFVPEELPDGWAGKSAANADGGA